MQWIKLGQVFAPSENNTWMISHAAVPFADHVEGDIYRIYFCTRDHEQRGRVGCVDINICHPGKILSISDTPVIDIGPLGAFDDHGVVGSWILTKDDTKYFYYSGMTLGVTVPFYFFTSIALKKPREEGFSKLSRAPLIGRTDTDPFLTGHACVLAEENTWKMWYVSGLCWKMENNQPKHYYHIRYAQSKDGITWKRDGTICIDFQEGEYAFGRPCVIHDKDCYRMWYSYRGDVYRIGYAESKDGIRWIRKDEKAGIHPSDTGWDAEMIAYAHVFDHKGKRYMVYNGNGYGKTGFGMAVLP